MACEAVFFPGRSNRLSRRLTYSFSRRQLSLFKHRPLAAPPVSFRSTSPRGRIGLSDDTSQHQIKQLGKLFKFILNHAFHQPTVEISWELPCKPDYIPATRNHLEGFQCCASVKQVKPVESNMHVLVLWSLQPKVASEWPVTLWHEAALDKQTRWVGK